jgi:hypothetical protein
MNEVYDLATDTWSTRASMPTARSGVGLAALDGKVYVIGGEGWIDELGGVSRAVEAYDPKRNSWAEEAQMPTPRRGFAKGVIDGKLYACLGHHPSRHVLGRRRERSVYAMTRPRASLLLAIFAGVAMKTGERPNRRYP